MSHYDEQAEEFELSQRAMVERLNSEDDAVIKPCDELLNDVQEWTHE